MIRQNVRPTAIRLTAQEKFGDQWEEYLAKLQQAVSETDGQVMTYDGELISATYFFLFRRQNGVGPGGLGGRDPLSGQRGQPRGRGRQQL